MSYYNEFDDGIESFQDIPLAVLEHCRPRTLKAAKGSIGFAPTHINNEIV